jgi:hypothetical protein
MIVGAQTGEVTRAQSERVTDNGRAYNQRRWRDAGAAKRR